MKSLYEILRSAKLGAGAAPDFHTAIMAQKMPFAKGSGAEHEYTGAVPVTFTANGQPLLDYLISGNTVQSGTPSPQNPVMPQGCGDLETIGVKTGQYKIPISSASTTTPVYLGEVPTTRKIKKLVLTGEENVSVTATGIAVIVLSTPPVVGEECVCSHYIGTNVATYSAIGAGECTTSIVASGGGNRLAINDVSLSTADAYKAFFTQQYAAGTPVTVWYVLANPETAVVNEPLMKIGDYADTLSMEQAGVQIPTASGSTTIDVNTTVKPSEIYIKYKS